MPVRRAGVGRGAAAVRQLLPTSADVQPHGAPAGAHPAVQQRRQPRRLLRLQLPDGQRHRGPGAGLPEEPRPARPGGGERAGLLLVHGARRHAHLAALRRRRERLPRRGRSPAHAAAHPARDRPLPGGHRPHAPAALPAAAAVQQPLPQVLSAVAPL